MGENSFKSIRNNVIAALITATILSLASIVFPEVRASLVQLLSWAWSGVMWVWGSLNASYSMSGWVWLLAGILSLIGMLNIYFGIRDVNNLEEPEWKAYVEDVIQGLKWRWEWVGGRVTGLWCFCSFCDATLVYDESSCYSYITNDNKTDFRCENCGDRVVASMSGNKNFAIGTVEREIHRRIRTSEYKKDVSRLQ